MIKAEYEQYMIDQGREIEALHQQHRSESQALKARVQSLEESLADAALNEEVPTSTNGCRHPTIYRSFKGGRHPVLTIIEFEAGNRSHNHC